MMYMAVRSRRKTAGRQPRRIAAAEARQNFSRLLGEVRTSEEPVIVEKGGIPIAAVVPRAVLEREQRWVEERADRLALLDRMRRPFRGVPEGTIEREAARAIAEVREERHKERARRR